MPRDDIDYSALALRAAQRAAIKVIKEAQFNQTPMPVWDGEKIVHIIPPLPVGTGFDDNLPEI